MAVDPRFELARRRHSRWVEQPHDARVRADFAKNVVEHQRILPFRNQAIRVRQQQFVKSRIQAIGLGEDEFAQSEGFNSEDGLETRQSEGSRCSDAPQHAPAKKKGDGKSRRAGRLWLRMRERAKQGEHAKSDRRAEQRCRDSVDRIFDPFDCTSVHDERK